MADIVTKIGTIHYDKLLSNYAVNYKSQRYKFIGDLLLAQVPVDKQGDKYAIFGARGVYDVANTLRAPGAKANEIDNLRVTDASYWCDEQAARVQIRLQNILNADKIIKEKMRKTSNLMDTLLLGKEKDVADLVFAAASYDSNHKAATGTKWNVDDWATVNPRIDVAARKATISSLIGIDPNTIVINRTIADGLMESPYIQSYLSSNVDKNIDAAVIARYFGVDRVLIGSSYYNSAKDGQTKSMSGLWGNHCLICYTDLSSSIDDPSFAKSFKWTGAGDADTQGRGLIGTRVYRNEETKVRYVETEMNYDNVITFQDASFFLYDVIS